MQHIKDPVFFSLFLLPITIIFLFLLLLFSLSQNHLLIISVLHSLSLLLSSFCLLQHPFIMCFLASSKPGLSYCFSNNAAALEKYLMCLTIVYKPYICCVQHSSQYPWEHSCFVFFFQEILSY